LSKLPPSSNQIKSPSGLGLTACLGLALGLLVSACAKDPAERETVTPTSTGGTGVTGTGGSSASGGVGTGGTPFVAGPRNPVADHGQLQVVGTQLQDAAGVPVQLKGVSSMWLNWETKPFAESKAALAYARDNWGLSVIRAAMAVEASGGYLTGAAGQAAMQTKVETIVRNAIDLGLYVIIDWHTGKANTQTDQAVTFFTNMATEFGTTPNVIYEPFNEPTGVTWAQIKPYHEAIVAAVRAVDPDNLIILGTPTYSQDVDIAARDPVAGTNLLYTLHFYSCTHKQSFRTKGSTALALGAALFITEFGATPADGGVTASGDNNICEAETNSWFDWMKTNNISGLAWKLEQCTDSSCILSPSAPVDGPWTDDLLTTDVGDPLVNGVATGGGHGQFVVNWIRQ
jgi:endoglucanase